MGRRRTGKPTMNDIAAAAGYSQTTVSFVLNCVPGQNIPETTRRRIAEAAFALGYAPPSSSLRGRQFENRQTTKLVTQISGRTGQRGMTGSFTDAVARTIAVDILSGGRPEGSYLPLDTNLGAEFGVSRTVMREAMKVLTSKGLLEAKTRVGTRVRKRSEWHLFDPDVLLWQAEAGLDTRFIRHLGEMRLILEPEAAALAARQRSKMDVDQLMGFADKMAKRGISADAFARADLDFHLAVAACADNPFLIAIGALIEISLISSLRRSWPGNEPGGTDRSANDHRNIAKAIADGDCEGARVAMRKVIKEGIARSTARLTRTIGQMSST